MKLITGIVFDLFFEKNRRCSHVYKSERVDTIFGIIWLVELFIHWELFWVILAVIVSLGMNGYLYMQGIYGFMFVSTFMFLLITGLISSAFRI